MINTRHIWRLTARLLAKEATAEELAELDLLLQKDALLRQQVQSLRDWWRPDNTGKGYNDSSAIEQLLLRIYSPDDKTL